MVTIKASECVACGACVDVCPNNAITCDDIAVINASQCTLRTEKERLSWRSFAKKLIDFSTKL